MNFFILSENDFLESFKQKSSQTNLVRQYLLELGAPPDKVGYKFLMDAINYVIDNDCNILSLTKEIYRNIEIRYKTSVSNIDRAIRYIIKYIWNNYDTNNIENTYGNTKKLGIPTNYEFIYHSCEKIRGIYTYPFLSE